MINSFNSSERLNGKILQLMNSKLLLHYHLVSHMYIYLKIQQKSHNINNLLAELAIEA